MIATIFPMAKYYKITEKNASKPPDGRQNQAVRRNKCPPYLLITLPLIVLSSAR